ncbi:MAG: hypothetical protein IPK07_14525 [Deltaproteobacteria bacterium]|nr:hypothetical protein [Deltaproteobacteria bacterium]
MARARDHGAGATLAAVLALALGAAAPANAAPALRDLDGTTERDSYTKVTRSAFFDGRMAELDGMGQRARDGKERFDDGTWKLATFYWVFRDAGRSRDDSDAAVLRANLDRWRTELPDSPIAHIALGEFVLGTAFHARGGKFAAQVPEENWAPFRARVKQARQILEDAPPAAKKCPGWYHAMLQVLRADGSATRDEATRIFEAGLALDPSYHALYWARVEALQPRWGGSFAALRELAERARTAGAATEGKSLYARVVWSALQFEGQDRLSDGTFEWPPLRDGFRDLVSRTPSSARNRQAFARYACVAGDRATTAERLRGVGDGWYSDVWQDADQFTKCRSLARGA